MKHTTKLLTSQMSLSITIRYLWTRQDDGATFTEDIQAAEWSSGGGCMGGGDGRRGIYLRLIQQELKGPEIDLHSNQKGYWGF